MNDESINFLIEVVLRSVIMFITLLVVLKLTGKRGIKQLSIFEMVIIISLGSAAGDPMFYKDVGIIPALVVFLVVLILYRVIIWLTAKSHAVEKFLEGETCCVVDEGKFSVLKFERESLAIDEFFTELRLRNVDHLGQVRKAYLETSGDVSVFFYPDKEVKPGLPILPELFEDQLTEIKKGGSYCCCKCGTIAKLSTGTHKCSECKCDRWVVPIHTTRVT